MTPMGRRRGILDELVTVIVIAIFAAGGLTLDLVLLVGSIWLPPVPAPIYVGIPVIAALGGWVWMRVGGRRR